MPIILVNAQETWHTGTTVFDWGRNEQGYGTSVFDWAGWGAWSFGLELWLTGAKMAGPMIADPKTDGPSVSGAKVSGPAITNARME